MRRQAAKRRLESERVSNPAGKTVKILIVDDHALFRAGLRMLLGTIGTHVSVLEAADTAQALALLRAHPDTQACLLDLALKDEAGLDAIQAIKDLAPQTAVVIVSGADDSATIRRCIDAGAMSFIPKSVTPDVLTLALQHVLGGAIFLPEQILATMDAAAPGPSLTARQLQVLQCLSRGLPTKLIARELGLSEHTVKDHITAIFQALGARNRTEAVIKASRLRLPHAGATMGA
jgi:DNA-binding NarL/FixJ family response regulator